MCQCAWSWTHLQPQTRSEKERFVLDLAAVTHPCPELSCRVPAVMIKLMEWLLHLLLAFKRRGRPISVAELNNILAGLRTFWDTFAKAVRQSDLFCSGPGAFLATSSNNSFLLPVYCAHEENFIARNSILAEYAVVGFELGYSCWTKHFLSSLPLQITTNHHRLWSPQGKLLDAPSS